MLMGLAFGAALAMTAAVFLATGAGNHSIRLALEITARWSFMLFWLAYAGGAVARLFPGTTILAGKGRDFGLAFAAAHLVHVGLVVRLYQISARAPLSEGLFLFFAAGIFFTYLLAALSFGNLVQAMGTARWRMIRLIGMNYILIAFGRDFLLPVIHPKPAQMNLAHFLAYLPFAVLTIAAPLLVLAATMRRPTPAAA
jgi:hypothetical protein